MKRQDIQTVSFEEVVLFDCPALFTDERLDRATLPAGFYMYEIRHSDDGSPISVEKSVWVDYFGAVLLTKPLHLNDDGYMDLEPGRNICYDSGNYVTLQNFLKKTA